MRIVNLPNFRKYSPWVDTTVRKSNSLQIHQLFKWISNSKISFSSHITKKVGNCGKEGAYGRSLFLLGTIFSSCFASSVKEAKCAPSNIEPSIDPFHLEKYSKKDLKEKEPDIFNYLYAADFEERTSETPPSLEQKIAFLIV